MAPPARSKMAPLHQPLEPIPLEAFTDRVLVGGAFGAAVFGCEGQSLLPRCAGAECTHVQTHRHSRSTTPWPDDYLFATGALASGASCDVGAAGPPGDEWRLSDHRPVVAEFTL
jgi:endonuclease/exonuclease/phosphatase (EEP) superfamily protein YafD